MTNYIVKEGETIMDVCVNATGTYLNLDVILVANLFIEWNPILTAGQSITIPDEVQIQSNILNIMVEYPICNSFNTSIESQINAILGIFANKVLFDDSTVIEALFDNDGDNVLFN